MARSTRLPTSISVSEQVRDALREKRDNGWFKTYDDVIRDLLGLEFGLIDYPPDGRRSNGGRTRWPFIDMEVGEVHEFSMQELDDNNDHERLRCALAAVAKRKGREYSSQVVNDGDGYVLQVSRDA